MMESMENLVEDLLDDFSMVDEGGDEDVAVDEGIIVDDKEMLGEGRECVGEGEEGCTEGALLKVPGKSDSSTNF